MNRVLRTTLPAMRGTILFLSVTVFVPTFASVSFEMKVPQKSELDLVGMLYPSLLRQSAPLHSVALVRSSM